MEGWKQSAVMCTENDRTGFVAEPEEKLDQGEFELRSLKGGGRGRREEMILAPPPLTANISDQPGLLQEAPGSSKSETEESFMKGLRGGTGRNMGTNKACKHSLGGSAAGSQALLKAREVRVPRTRKSCGCRERPRQELKPQVGEPAQR